MLPNAMKADVIDYDTLRTGENRADSLDCECSTDHGLAPLAAVHRSQNLGYRHR